MPEQTTPVGDPQLHRERWELLEHFNAATEKPMIALAFVWLLLLILDFTVGLNPLLQSVSTIIWILFIVDFVLEFIVAPDKSRYLRRNWLTAVSLVLPALRILRIFRALRVLRAVRAVRTVSLLRLVTSINRSMRAAANTLGRRNIGYLIALTLIVLFAGAAGMALFESPASLVEAGHTEDAQAGAGFQSYAEAVWWTAMILTTLGSAYWPLTAEGRILCWLLSVYALAVFSYLTATIASYFVGVDRTASPKTTTDSGVQQEITALRRQLTEIQEVILSSQADHRPQ